jgi:transcriptional regulator with XRE-family HTH domain
VRRNKSTLVYEKVHKVDKKGVTMLNTMNEFVDWVQHLLDTHGLKQADIARNQNITTAAVSKLMNRQSRPGFEMCAAIAATFNLPLEEVYRQAGLLPPKPSGGIFEERATYLFNQLPEEDQQEVLDYLDYRLQKHQQRETKKGTGT